MADFSHIDEGFKNAFEHWDAPHTPAEMQSAWSNVAHQVGGVAPSAHNPAGSHAAGHVASGIGKIIGLSGIGAAAVASVIILYNIYVRPAAPAIHHPSTQQIAEKQLQGNQPIISNGAHQDAGIKSERPGQAGAPTTNNTRTGSNMPVNPFSGQSNGGSVSGQANAAGASAGDTKMTSGGARPSQPQMSPSSTSSSVASLQLDLSDETLCINQNVSANTGANGYGQVLNWGDGTSIAASGQDIHSYTRAGRYSISLGTGQAVVTRYLTVIDRPKSKFSMQLGADLKCTFNNTSRSGDSYDWDFGDGSNSESGYFASHTYADTGRYRVQLIATNTDGCADTLVQYINVQQLSEPKVPNVITPNGDGLNDDVAVSITGETYFEFTIVDRDGKIVFQSKDKTQKWNGKNQSTGEDCKPGTYYYTVAYSFKQNEIQKTKPGIITLLRSKN